MSYSFMVKAATVPALMAATAEKLDEVMSTMPDLDATRDQVLSAAQAFAATLGDAPEDKLLSLSIAGSIYSEDWKLLSVSFSLTGSFVDDDTKREAAPDA